MRDACVNTGGSRRRLHGHHAMDRLIRIAAASVAIEDLERLRQLVEQLCTRTGDVLRWVDAADADLLFIDVDSLNGHMDLLQARANGRRVVSIAKSVAGDQQVFLTRPLSADGLLAAIAHYREELGVAPREPDDVATAQRPTLVRVPLTARLLIATATGAEQSAAQAGAVAIKSIAPPAQVRDAVGAKNASVLAMAKPSAVPSNAIATELSLAEFCTVEALARPSRIVHADAPALTIDNESGVYFGPPGLKALEPYCRGPIPRSAWEPVSSAVLEGLRAAGGGQPLARLVWLYALFAGNGSLLGGVDASSRFRVAKWPQMEREFPRHFRIATAMMKGMATVDAIAAQSGAPTGEVADFINASLLGGHVEMESPTVVADAPDASQSGLLARLGLRGRKA